LPAGTDAEATLSAEYGGTGGSNAAVDAVYVALGRVLTISGRTIKDEAQVSKFNLFSIFFCIFCFNANVLQYTEMVQPNAEGKMVKLWQLGHYLGWQPLGCILLHTYPGGTGGSSAAVVAVYVALGRVLTSRGCTIKDEAHVRKR
jgi:hypothetical protein